jgi:hypothetical protein
MCFLIIRPMEPVALGAALIVRPVPLRLPLLLALAVALMFLPPTWFLLALFPIGVAMATCFDLIDRIPSPFAIGLIVAGCMIAAIDPMNIRLLGMLAASSFVIGCIAYRPVRTFLENDFSGWLGWVSFPLYLIHGPIMFVVGEPLTRMCGARVSIDPLTVAAAIGAAIVFAAVNDFAIRVARFVGRWLPLSAVASLVLLAPLSHPIL